MMADAAFADLLVQVIGEQGAPTEARTLHLLGDRELVLQLHLTGEPHVGQIRASLHQIAAGISAPIAKDLALAILDRGGSTAAARVILPAVRSATLMELRFTAQAEPAPARPAGKARLVVYPADHAAQLKAQFLAAQARAEVKLGVVSESPELKAVLRAAGLPFEERDAIGAGLIHLAQAEGESGRRLCESAPPDSRLLLFTNDPLLPAGVYWTERGRGFIAKATLPVLADFHRAPERQALFYHLLHRALAPPGSP
jgi:hypothetical protein